MQNKGAIKLFAVLLSLVTLYQLSFSFFTNYTENKAVEFGERAQVLAQAKQLASATGLPETIFLDSLKKDAENFFLDSIAGEKVYNLGLFGYTYRECKERELNLGLDLKGGMNVTLEVSVEDIVINLAGTNKKEPAFQKAINDALKMQRNSQEDFITLFVTAFKKNNPSTPLASIFATVDLKGKVGPNSTDDEVIAVLRDQAKVVVGNTYDILKKRIDKFGVTQPRIQRLQTEGRILVELPGVKDPKRVRKLLQSSARLEFWETYSFKDEAIFNNVIKANDIISEKYTSYEQIRERQIVVDTAETVVLDSAAIIAAAATEKAAEPKNAKADKKVATAKTDKKSAKVEKTEEPTLAVVDTPKTDELNLTSDTVKKAKKSGISLFQYMRPNFVQNQGGYYPGNGAVVGTSMIHDTAKVMAMFNLPEVRALFPRGLKLLWGVKPPRYAEGQNILELFAIKVSNRDGEPPLDGLAITDARQDYDQQGQVEVNMTMNAEGALKWKNLTGDHIGEAIAIVLDNAVYSAPNVMSKIEGGRSQISGGFTIQEAEDLANVLKSGKLPVPARIIEEAVVGPSLGKEAINAGMISFLLAFVLILVYMFVFYNKAGLIANIALVGNIFFMFGVLASLQAVLTLPGIAGMVLTLGMAVDSNVIIYERIKEELRSGKGMRLAIEDGYKASYSAIIDGNVTTLLTAIVLYIFGSGPIQGFATTLIIGILTSLFTSIFFSRTIIEAILNRKKEITFYHEFSKNFLKNVKFKFVDNRKYAYIISITITVIGIVSLLTRGLEPGVDFAGGRTYVVRFDQPVNTQQVAQALKLQFVDASGKASSPEVTTFGPNSQVKITTKFMIDEKGTEVDSIVDNRVYQGVKGFYKTPISTEVFFADDDNKVVGKLSSQKVDPTISDDLMYAAYLAVFFALIAIFIYIAIRFKNWQFGLGGVVSLFHDAFIIVTVYSVFSGILPFDLEINQDFIAVILTIIGYSINDTVIIFDRVREYRRLYPKHSLKQNMDEAFTSTLSRTINTQGTTLVVLIAIFVFGGEVIRGFSFALMIGIMVGTYSSIFVASPVAYELLKGKKENNLDGKE